MKKTKKEDDSMLQDLSRGRLENEYRPMQPEDQDLVVLFSGSQLVIRREEDRSFLPTYQDVCLWQETGDWKPWLSEGFQYAFRMQEKNYFLYLGDFFEADLDSCQMEPVRTLRNWMEKDLCFGIMTAWHLYTWYRNNRFCGCCGEKTHHDSFERMMRCDHCGNMIFPKIAPAIIVAITNGDNLLLSKYAGREYTHYALIAGYTEIGETIEQTVRRETMEEVGLKVKNIRYYKSQPWGVDGNVLMGFYCDVDGDDTIHLDERELSLAEWHPRDAIPAKDDGISLTREMIRTFEEGKEPK